MKLLEISLHNIRTTTATKNEEERKKKNQENTTNKMLRSIGGCDVAEPRLVDIKVTVLTVSTILPVLNDVIQAFILR